MRRSLKATNVIVIGDTCQGAVSDAIKSVLYNERERGITIQEILEKDKYIEINKAYRYECVLPISHKIFFNKPRSKFHR